MKKILLLIALCTMLYACGTTKSIKYSNVSKRTFIITDIDAPKNFKVDLKDVKNGKRYRNVPVARKCDRWKEFRVGDVLKLKIGFFEIEGKQYYEFVDIEKVMCK